MNLWSSALVYGRMIKFTHSILALPFAFSGAALAAAEVGITLVQIGWIALAMVGARSAAMGFNRLADRHLDAANPRTAGRELPRGVVAPVAVGLFVALSSAALVLAAWQLNPLCLYFSPLVLASNDSVVMIANKPTPAEDEPYQVQILNGNTGAILKTLSPDPADLRGGGKILKDGYIVNGNKYYYYDINGKKIREVDQYNLKPKDLN